MEVAFGGYNIHYYPQTLRGIIVKVAGRLIHAD